MAEGVLREHRKLEQAADRRARTAKGDDDGKIQMPASDFRALPVALRQRLVLLDRLSKPLADELKDAVLADAVEQFKRDIPGLETAARMEHQRWMGERLASGWQFGPACNTRRRRVTMVPWDDLNDHERIYDFVQIPRIILESGPRWNDSRFRFWKVTEPRYYASIA